MELLTLNGKEWVLNGHVIDDKMRNNENFIFFKWDLLENNNRKGGSIEKNGGVFRLSK